MSEELKPCPFCGGAVKMTRHKGSDETGERWDYFAVECRGKDHNVICDSGDTAEEVAASWNRRAPMTALTTPPAGEEAYEDARDLIAMYQFQSQRSDANAAKIVAVARALLSSPRVEEVRRMREALEKIAEPMGALQAWERGAERKRIAAEALASLSPQGG